MTRRAVWQDRAEMVFKVLFLILGFLQYSSLTFGKPIISWVQWPMLGLGGVLVLLRLLRAKEYLAAPGLWLMLAFAAAFGVSSLLNIRYGWYENVRFLVFLGFQITLLYPYSRERDPAVSRRHWTVAAWTFLVGTFLLSLLSFVFLFTGRAEVFLVTDGPTYYIGFWWGRLFGAYWDPNIAAVMAAMACLLSVSMMIRHRSVLLRILLGANMLLQTCYVVLSDSRAGKVAFFVASGTMAFLTALRLLKEKKAAVRTCLSLAAALAIAVTNVGLLVGGCRGYNAVADYYQSVISSEDPSDPDTHDKTSHSFLSPVGRGEDIESDVSNRRFDIWKSALTIFTTRPIFGVSYANIIPYARENLPDLYILTNDHMVFSSMHNVLMDVLAGQGLVGLLLFLAMAAFVLVRLLKHTAVFFADERFYEYAAAFALVVTAVVSSMFMTELVYVITPLTLMFWISLGTLAHRTYAAPCEPEKEDQA